MTPRLISQGGVDSVSLPQGEFVYHTHPRGCPTLDDCSIIPPSADDMKIFASRGGTQVVVSKDFTYILRLRPEYEFLSDNADNVFQFFQVIENHFDELTKGAHSDYENLWMDMIIWCQWFNVIRFNNKSCLHSFSSNQIYKVIPPKLISLASPVS